MNGSVTDKWCSNAAGDKILDVDLGAPSQVTGFAIRHAETGGESPALNTRAFHIQTSPDGLTWTTRVTVAGNTGAGSTHSIASVSARHTRLVVTTPTQNRWRLQPVPDGPVPLQDVTPEFGAVGFKYSLSLVSTTPQPGGDRDVLPMLAVSPRVVQPIQAGPVAGSRGTVVVSTAGYGSDDGGEEYSNTAVAVSVNGRSVGQFSTAVDCVGYAQFSPDGEPGIFQRNTGDNPRGWCPGALVPNRYFDTGPIAAGEQVRVTLSLGRPGPYGDGSFYRTSIAVIEG